MMHLTFVALTTMWLLGFFLDAYLSNVFLGMPMWLFVCAVVPSLVSIIIAIAFVVRQNRK